MINIGRSRNKTSSIFKKPRRKSNLSIINSKRKLTQILEKAIGIDSVFVQEKEISRIKENQGKGKEEKNITSKKDIKVQWKSSKKEIKQQRGLSKKEIMKKRKTMKMETIAIRISNLLFVFRIITL